MNQIADPDTLRGHMGQVNPMAERKILDKLDRHCRRFIELSPFLVLASADADGQVDASPRGDPPGFVRILDDTTLLLPDRPGNNRVDSFGNILSAPGIGLIFFVPGIDETLRVNGTASVFTEADTLAPSQVGGKLPRTGLLIHVAEAFFHCGKALKRSRLWDQAAKIERAEFPTLGRILAEQIGGMSPEEADAKVATGYRDRMY